jgi:hypothetical protein
MNLKSQYKRLFEGKARSNDQKLLKEDYSTMRLKSNIDQKWQTADDMAGDMQQWLSSIYSSGGEDVYQEVMGILQNLADNFDPEDEM